MSQSWTVRLGLARASSDATDKCGAFYEQTFLRNYFEL
jgi:hypothetical protein